MVTTETATRSPESSPLPFRADIEGLRGVAILLVVLYHCNVPGLSGGYTGVDVFFVLSGFLITGILVREVQTTSRLNLLEFYARRARRLLPAFAVTLVTTLLLGVILLPPQELDLAARAARSAALHMSNIFFDKNTGDYFSPNIQSNPLLHTWSLAVEEQFYLFWPLLILLSVHWWRSTNALMTLLSGLTLISLGIGIGFTIKGGTFAFYELPARAWEFGMGGLALFLSQRTPRVSPLWWSTIGWVGFLAILGVAHFLTPLDAASFPGWIALIPTLGTAVVLIAGTESPSRGVGSLLTSTPLRQLGKLSYSWYLWHWPLLVFAEALLPTGSLAGKLAVAAGSLAIAVVTYHFIERPIRFHQGLLKRPALSVGLAAIVMMFSLGTSLLSLKVAENLATQPMMSTITAASQDSNHILSERDCYPSLESPEVKLCTFGNQTSETHLILFGDSHAMHWVGPLSQIADLNGWRLTTVVKPSCPAFDIRPSTFKAHEIRQLDTYNVACAQWRAEALTTIKQLHPTLILLGNATSHLAQQYEHLFAKPSQPSLEELRGGVRNTLNALSGHLLAVLRDVPHFPYNIPTCLARSVRHDEDPQTACDADPSIVLNPTVYESERAGANNISDVHFIDMTDLICQSGTCQPIQGDTIVYRDTDHMTTDFAGHLIAGLTNALQIILEAHFHQG
ncbi:MAG TPA: acyltransferase family protein [Nitrospira sp.]|nr:acyltransferase family protein [Nitrospira sp.]